MSLLSAHYKHPGFVIGLPQIFVFIECVLIGVEFLRHHQNKTSWTLNCLFKTQVMDLCLDSICDIEPLLILWSKLLSIYDPLVQRVELWRAPSLIGFDQVVVKLLWNFIVFWTPTGGRSSSLTNLLQLGVSLHHQVVPHCFFVPRDPDIPTFQHCKVTMLHFGCVWLVSCFSAWLEANLDGFPFLLAACSLFCFAKHV